MLVCEHVSLHVKEKKDEEDDDDDQDDDLLRAKKRRISCFASIDDRHYNSDTSIVSSH